MSKLLFGAFIILFASCESVQKASQGVTHVQNSKSRNRLRAFSEHTLSNGLRVLLVKDDSLPSVSYQMLIKTGSSSDPAQKTGLSLMVASLLEKGTQQKTATQLADELAILGASFQASVDSDYVVLSAGGLSTYRDQLLDLFIEIVTKPSFADAEVERMRKQILAALLQAMDNPSGFADMAFNQYLFNEHPYGRSLLGKKKDVQSIRRGQIIRHYLQYYRPNNAILAVVGDFGSNILDRLESELRTWKSRSIKPVQFENLAPISKLEMRLINKSDLTQAQIVLGQEGVSRKHKDFLALRLANVILGQGFSSRLVDEVRDNLGLTYSIGSEIEARLLAGSFEISTFTRNEKVGEALQKILAILDQFVKKGVSDNELEAAKGYLIGNFGRSIETADKLAFNLLVLRAYGIPDSYLFDFEDNVDILSVAQINRVIHEHFHPERQRVLVLANQAQVLPQLSGFQSVEVKQATEFQ